jgi:CrcB protein
VARADPNPNLRLLLVTGVLGGYTTFSSFAWESFEAIDKEQIWIGLANILLSVVFGYLAVWCGAWVARVLR